MELEFDPCIVSVQRCLAAGGKRSVSDRDIRCYRSLTAASPAATAPAAPAVSPVVCTEKFTPITAGDYVAAMEPGWNLGNTLDAIPTEGSWNNAPVVSSTFDDIKAAGFKSVRIPGWSRIDTYRPCTQTNPSKSDLHPPFRWQCARVDSECDMAAESVGCRGHGPRKGALRIDQRPPW